MVDALWEARRVLTPPGVLIDVRPVLEPIVVEVLAADGVIWSKTVATYSAPEDVMAADAAIQHALSREWIVFERCCQFGFEIYCDSAAELRAYAEGRKLCGAEIPYEELEERQRRWGVGAHAARLRCHRVWEVRTYRRSAGEG